MYSFSRDFISLLSLMGCVSTVGALHFVLTTDNTYSHNEWSENDPAELPPHTGLVANHFLNIVIEVVHTWKHR